MRQERPLDRPLDNSIMVETKKLPVEVSNSIAEYCKYLERVEMFAKAQAGQVEEG